MHIAWIGKKSPPCGNVTYSREITNTLLDRGYQVSFFHFAQENTVAATADGVTVDCQEVSLPFLYKSQVYTIPTLRSSKVLFRSLQLLQPDVVHASLTLSPLDFVLPEICEELNVPLIATFHPPFSHKHRNLSSGTQHFMYQVYTPALANYDAVIIFSQGPAGSTHPVRGSPRKTRGDSQWCGHGQIFPRSVKSQNGIQCRPNFRLPRSDCH